MTDSFEVSEERESDPTSISDSPSPGSSLTDLTLVTRQQSADLLAAHLRWGHRSFRSCARVLGIPSTAESPFCVACVEAKASRHPRRARGGESPLLREPATRPGFRLFFDPIGPFRVPTLSRFKYALGVMDDYSGLIHLRLMVRLSEWFSHLSALVKRIEAEKGSERVVAQIGSDSFPAFVSGTQILEFAASRGILLLASPPYTQKLNPVEGAIKILVRMALAMLRHAGAPRALVEFALVQATLLLNRLPRARKGERDLVIPLNRWLGMEPPSVLHVLKVWVHRLRPCASGQREVRLKGGPPDSRGLRSCAECLCVVCTSTL